MFSYSDDDTGIVVNEQTAMSLSAVYRAVKLLSDSVAMLPLITYKRVKVNGKLGKEKDVDNPIYFTLKEQPNQWQTPFEFKRLMQVWILLKGNGYAEIITDNAGITHLIPREPDYIQPFMAPDGKRAYRYQPPEGGSRIILQSEMYHVMNLSTTDGIEGVGVIENHRRTLGMSIGAEKHGARLYKNGARPGGVLEHPGKLGDQAHKSLKDSWGSQHQGVDNSQKVAILEEGMIFKPISMTPEDVQYIETRKFQVTDIARLFGVPSHMLNDLERATFSNIEHQSLEFVRVSLMPWLTLWEQATNRDLFSIKQRRVDGNFVQFTVEALLRGDLEARSNYYATARNWGWLSVNEIRELENLNAIEGGEEYLQPLNMIGIGEEPEDETVRKAREVLELTNRNGTGHE